MSAIRITELGLEPRAAKHTPPSSRQVTRRRAWIRWNMRPTRAIERDFSSYTYKHSVEVWADVSNGAFIEAARLEGHRFEPSGPGSLNALRVLRRGAR